VSAPFGRRVASVVSRRALGAYVVLAVADASEPEPGQFFMVSAVEGWGGGVDERPFLGRALSVLYARDGELGFLLEDVGPGTHRLCALAAGGEVRLVGPLGRGFVPPAEREALLVGGGVGVPPLAFFQERFGGRALVGFRSGEHAQAASLFADPLIATDDGSVGHRGFVTELIEAGEPARVYACGPPALLDAVRAIAAADAQLALEAPMACGYGACYGCVVATVAGYARVCVEGPVFEAATLA
jgi:dihydroorotate dehydrogenase electron transfer subunit